MLAMPIVDANNELSSLTQYGLFSSSDSAKEAIKVLRESHGGNYKFFIYSVPLGHTFDNGIELETLQKEVVGDFFLRA